MKRIIAIIVSALLALGAGGGVYYFIIYRNNQTVQGGRTSSNSDDAVYVDSVKIIAGLESVTGLIPRYAGVVEPQETWEAKLEGDKNVKQTYVKEGDSVKVGDKLFTYDTAEDEEKLAQAQIDLERNESDLENKKFQLESWEKQKPKDDATDEVKLEYTATLLQYQTDVKSTEYDIRQGREEIKNLEATLQKADVLSELEGVIKKISKNSNSNNYYMSDGSDAYITVMAVGDFRVKGTVNEQHVNELNVGDEVLAYSRVDNQVWHGIITEIKTDTGESNQNENSFYGYGDSDSSSGSTNYPFFVKLDNSDGLLLGQHVYLEPDRGQSDRRDGIWIPDYYFEFDESNNAWIWVASETNRLERRRVTLGEYDVNLASYELLSGLDADDYISVPDETLKEGLPVIYVQYGEGEENLYMDSGSYDWDEFDDGSWYDEELEDIWYDDGSWYEEDDEEIWYDEGSWYDYDEGSLDVTYAGEYDE
ncbi:MAG: biotin/lipoyl-binding protein [Lachnospiraceae bacterium]|nr:biotin/lipoyl-binding protein [Lachnospiraceae bacterium]